MTSSDSKILMFSVWDEENQISLYYAQLKIIICQVGHLFLVKTKKTLDLSGIEPQSQDYKFYTLHSQPQGIQIEQKFMRKKSCYDIDFLRM